MRKGGILWSFRAGFVFFVHSCGHVVLGLKSGRRSRSLLSTGVCSRGAMGLELMIWEADSNGGAGQLLCIVWSVG